MEALIRLHEDKLGLQEADRDFGLPPSPSTPLSNGKHGGMAKRPMRRKKKNLLSVSLHPLVHGGHGTLPRAIRLALVLHPRLRLQLP